MAEVELTERIISSAQAEYDSLRNVSPEQPCPYLPGRQARSEVYWVDRLAPGTYERLLARGFRRSGRIVYRPRCRTCHECRQMRVLVGQFQPTRSMRRVLRRNGDLRAEVGLLELNAEKHDLYCRYLDGQHDGSMSRDFSSFRDFLYDSPLPALEIRYRIGERLVGVSVLDRCPKGLSSVYMFYDPAMARRSLGTFSILWEVEYCRGRKLPYYYLGYYVAGSRTMAYKARFRPAEILVDDNRWIALPA
jgi:arginine-tRNA-protein transferase